MATVRLGKIGAGTCGPRPTPPGRTDLTLLSPVDPQSEREFLYANQNRRCIGCQYELPLHVLTIDHITPRSRGGLDSVGNLQLMCHTCNAIKGNRDMAYSAATAGGTGAYGGDELERGKIEPYVQNH